MADLACPEGLEPPTCCLEGNCSIQLSYGQRGSSIDDGLVGAAGFELATYWSQTSCATRLRYAPNDVIVGAVRAGASGDAAAIGALRPGQRVSSAVVGAGSISWREMATHCWMCCSQT